MSPVRQAYPFALVLVVLVLLDRQVICSACSGTGYVFGARREGRYLRLGNVVPCSAWFCRKGTIVDTLQRGGVYVSATEQTENRTMGKTVKTPEAIISYPALFRPKTNDQNGKTQYSCTLIFPKGSDLAALIAAANEVGVEKFGTKFKLGAGKFNSPFRTDVEEKGYPEGSTFINVRSDYKPQVVDRFRGSDGKPVPIGDDESDKIYPGCRVKASVTAFAYDSNGNRGVSFGLGNVMKLGDGPRLDGRMSARDEFADEDLEEMEAPSDDDLPF